MADYDIRRLARDAQTKQVSAQSADAAAVRAGILTEKQMRGAKALEILNSYLNDCTDNHTVNELETCVVINCLKEMFQLLNYKEIPGDGIESSLFEVNNFWEKDGLRHRIEIIQVVTYERKVILGRWVSWFRTSQSPIRIFIENLKVEAERLFNKSKLV